MAYLTDNEMANNKLIHQLAFASKNPAVKIKQSELDPANYPVTDDIDYVDVRAIQDVNGVPDVATAAETFRAALAAKIKTA